MPAVEDFELIAKRAKFIKAMAERKCANRNGGTTPECWCWKAGPNGEHLPCPSE